MKTVEELLADIIRRETGAHPQGGYTNDPADPGGPTKWGITLETLKQWRGKPTTAADVQALEQWEAEAIYRQRYIAPFLTSVPPDVMPFVVDLAVHSGVGGAQRLLRAAEQRVQKGLPPMSPLYRALVHERLAFFSAQVRTQPAKLKFLRGWLNRVVEFI
jgi:lysozyme family protein